MVKLIGLQSSIRGELFKSIRLESGGSRKGLARPRQSNSGAITSFFKYLPRLLCIALCPTLVFAEPQIENITGVFSDKESITIEGSGFTSKSFPAPLLWWNADDGIDPSQLGRISDWVDSETYFHGELTDQVTAVGSDTALRYDHGSGSGGPLGRVDFESDRIYLHRKVYEDFDITKNVVFSVGLSEISGTFEEGQKVTGTQSGATGYVYEYYRDRGAIRFLTDNGSINQEIPVYFKYGEKLVSSTGSGVNISGGKWPTDILKTFNYKIVRFHAEPPTSNNNIWVGAQGAESNEMRLTPEYTNNTVWPSQMKFPFKQRPNTWRTEEFVYQSSDLDTANGLFSIIVDGKTAYDDPIITRTSENPARYDWISQSQVSNGAKPGSWVYYDSLYIDDSWHRVIACNEPEWDQCENPEPQIPLAWSDSEIVISVNQGSLVDNERIFIYVVNKDGEVNSNGYEICPECPAKPELTID